MNPPKLQRNLRIVKLRQAGISFEQIAQMTREGNTKPLSRQAVQKIYKDLVQKINKKS